MFISLLKREAKAASDHDRSAHARLVQFVKSSGMMPYLAHSWFDFRTILHVSSGRKLESTLAAVKWYDEILALFKLLNDVPLGIGDSTGLASISNAVLQSPKF